MSRKTGNLNTSIFVLPLFYALFAAAAFGQTYNSNTGGYNTGYGTVYGSFGLAMATQNMYNFNQMNMQRLTMRQAMINKWGKAAVEKAEREAAAGRGTASGGTRAGARAEGPVIAPLKNVGKFRPVANAASVNALADAVGETPAEKQLIRNIFKATKTAFEKEAGPRGWSNNIAGGLAFFTVTAMTVYHDEEPSEEASQAFFFTLNQTMDEVPEFAAMTNKQKQEFYDLMIGFSGILLAGYMEGKESGDRETLAAYQKIAGGLIELVLKVEPRNLRTENGSIVIR